MNRYAAEISIACFPPLQLIVNFNFSHHKHLNQLAAVKIWWFKLETFTLVFLYVMVEQCQVKLLIIFWAFAGDIGISLKVMAYCLGFINDWGKILILDSAFVFSLSLSHTHTWTPIYTWGALDCWVFLTMVGDSGIFNFESDLWTVLVLLLWIFVMLSFLERGYDMI